MPSNTAGMKFALTLLTTALPVTVSGRGCGVKNDSGGNPHNLECIRPDNPTLENLCCNSFGCDPGEGPAVFGGNPGDLLTKDKCQCTCSPVP